MTGKVSNVAPWPRVAQCQLAVPSLRRAGSQSTLHCKVLRDPHVELVETNSRCPRDWADLGSDVGGRRDRDRAFDSPSLAPFLGVHARYGRAAPGDGHPGICGWGALFRSSGGRGSWEAVRRPVGASIRTMGSCWWRLAGGISVRAWCSRSGQFRGVAAHAGAGHSGRRPRLHHPQLGVRRRFTAPGAASGGAGGERPPWARWRISRAHRG